MNKELFGVFGDYEKFSRFRSPGEFDEIVSSGAVTVGIRDPGLDVPGRSSIDASNGDICAVWGEAFTPDDCEASVASWLLERYREAGTDALSELNGSYLAVVDVGGEAGVATDPIRSWECFYTDDPGVRVFGTDSVAVSHTIETPRVHEQSVFEFLHVGVVLGEKTSFEQLRRLPIDSTLQADAVEPLRRFVYDPRTFDYVDELARRLSRAIRRRTRYPGEKGLLLSAGYDSRLLLSRVDTLDRSYTVGASDAQEVQGARRLSAQYDVSHESFPPDGRYLLANDRKVRYSQGIKESLHVHHAGFDDEIGVDTMYHGLLCDTVFRGHFTEQASVEMLGKRIPFAHLDPNPDPVEVLLGKFGYRAEASQLLSRYTSADIDPETFVRDMVRTEFDAHSHRYDSIQNGLDCCGIGNQPSMPFHTQLADNYFESFLATDIELLDWHLQTPPEHRTTETFRRACKRLDPDILQIRPPDRPHNLGLLNEVERVVRQKTPLVRSFEPPWPDRAKIFERYDLDRRLFPDVEYVHDLPVRHKLRVNDVFGWMGQCSEPVIEIDDVLHEPVSNPA